MKLTGHDHLSLSVPGVVLPAAAAAAAAMSVSLQARGLATPRLACFTYPHSAPIKRIPSSVSPLCPSLERGGGSEPTKVEWSGPDSITHMTHLHRGRLVYAVRPDVFQHLRRTVSARPRPSSEPLTPRISCR